MSKREGEKTNGPERFHVMFVCYQGTSPAMIIALASPPRLSVGVVFIKTGLKAAQCD